MACEQQPHFADRYPTASGWLGTADLVVLSHHAKVLVIRIGGMPVRSPQQQCPKHGWKGKDECKRAHKRLRQDSAPHRAGRNIPEVTLLCWGETDPRSWQPRPGSAASNEELLAGERKRGISIRSAVRRGSQRTGIAGCCYLDEV